MQIEKRCPGLVSNRADTMNLLFHDFNSGSRQFRFGMNNNVRLASKGDFRRTGMAGAQLIDKNVIDLMENNFIFNFIRFSLKFDYLNPTYSKFYSYRSFSFNFSNLLYNCCIPDLVSCPMLETALKENPETISILKNMTKVDIHFNRNKEQVNKIFPFECIEEFKNSECDKEESIDKHKHKHLTENAKGNLKVTQKFTDVHCDLICSCIIKISKQLNKSKQVITRISSLKGICKNILNNIANSKETLNEWRDAIRGDVDLQSKVVYVMTKIGIINISDDLKSVEILTHKFEEFNERSFNEEEFKENVKMLLIN